MTFTTPTVNGVEAYKLSITWTLGQPESISYTMYAQDAAAMGGGSLPAAKGVFKISFGSGTIAQMLSNGPQLVYDQPGYVSETGKSIAVALQQSAIIHRFTAQQITVNDAFNGTLNGITSKLAPPNIITHGLLPGQQGIAKTSMGVNNTASALAFTFVLDGSIQSQVLDVDIFEDNLLHATETICQHMGSFVDPQHTMIAIDSGPQTVTIGKMGATAGSITFGSDAIPVLRLTTAQAQTTDMCYSCTFTGGDTHHGLPATGKITDCLTQLNGYPLVAVYSAIDVGGVYFWRGDGAFYPVSQAMGVNGLWYNSETSVLFAATDAGVYTADASGYTMLANTTPWPRLGAMALKCHRVQVDGSAIYTLAEFTSGNRHILQSSPGTTAGLGYDDWVSVYSQSDIIDFAVMNNYIYAIVSNNQGTVIVVDATGSTAPSLLQLPLNGTTGLYGNITGLDPISQDGSEINSVVLRTDQGSAAMFYIASGSPTSAIQCDTSALVDDFGAAVMINSVRGNGGLGYVYAGSGGGIQCFAIAATSLGVWFCPNQNASGGWQRTDGQSSIGDFVCNVAATGVDAGIGASGQSFCYAAGDSAWYVSYNGSVNWIDALSEPMDAGPYFYNYFWEGSKRLPAATDTTIPVSLGSGDFMLRRVQTGIGTYTYELYNPSSQAPAAQHRSAELSQISSSALMSPITASRQLVEGMARFLAFTARPQQIVEVQSVAFDSGSPLLNVRPCWAASVTGVPNDYIIGSAPFVIGNYAITGYVLEHEINYDRDSDPNAATTRTRIGTILIDDRTDPLKVSSDIYFQLSRSQLYKTKARH